MGGFIYLGLVHDTFSQTVREWKDERRKEEEEKQTYRSFIFKMNFVHEMSFLLIKYAYIISRK